MSRRVLIPALALAAIGFAAPVSHAAIVSFDVPGWTIIYDNGVVPTTATNRLTVTDLQSTAGGVSLEKTATFTDDSPVVITFTRLPGDGPTRITFEDETLTNFTSAPWTSFTFALSSPDNSVVFNQAASAGLNIAPFTTRTYSADGTTLTVSGGSVGNGPLDFPWQPGKPNDTGGELVIFAPLSAGQSFSLVELPGVIPEPAAMTLLAPVALLLKRRR